MELRHALQTAVRSGAATSQSLLGLSASRWVSPSPRWLPAATAVVGGGARCLSTTHALLADKPARKPFPSLSTKPDSSRKSFDAWTRPSRPPRTSPASASPPSTGQPSKTPSVFGDEFEDPMDLARDIGLQADEFMQSHMPKAAAPPPLRLRASTGKSVQVHGHIDVVRSFQLLQMLCAKNRLPMTVQQQRFHERPGLKRKRLRRERWRRKFKAGFKATVQRVRDLSRQGW